jgi:rifampicin phosphotransferase
MEQKAPAMLIIPLETIDDAAGDLVGNKALGIARLIRLGIPVPEGFCISTDAYRDHLERCRGEDFITRLHEGDKAALLQDLRRAIISQPLSGELMISLKEHLDKIRGAAVAVRSSATVEDCADHSFAGLFETHMGERDPGTCAMRVKKCWASLWTERVLRYCRSYDIEHGGAAMAVVVQRLLDASSSGVIFTGDLSGRRGERLLIEACPGLGEALASGQVTPDRFVVQRERLKVLERHISAKSMRLQIGASGSMEECPLSPREGRKASMDEKQIRQLCTMALKAEPDSGQGQDIEWAWEHGRLFLLQCRPVTALIQDISSGPPHVWSNANAGEVLPDVVTPLTQSFVIRFIDILFFETLRKIGIDFGPLNIVEPIDGRFYFDLTALSEMIQQVPGFRSLNVGRMLGGHRWKLISRLIKRLPGGYARPHFDVKRLLCQFPLFAISMMTNSRRQATKKVEELRERTAALKSNDLASLSEARMLEIHRGATEAMMKMIPDIMLFSGGFLSYQKLIRLCSAWLEDKDGSLANGLLVGIGTLDSADPGLALCGIASLIQDNRDLAQTIEGEAEFASLRDKSTGLPGAEEFLALWDDFMARHGHHAIGELEFYNPRWAETPDYVLSLVKACLGKNEKRDFLGDYRRRAEMREELTKECRVRLKNPFKRMMFDHILGQSQREIAMRETIKSEAVRQIAFMRLIYLRLGSLYKARGIIERDEDVFFLRVEELESLHRGGTSFNARELIAQRREEYEKNKGLPSHPIVVGTPGEKKYIPCEIDDALDMFNGIAVSPGIARGPARVIVTRNEEEFVHPGEILVIPFADPGWAPYFINSAGIVMDMGGMLSHGCIIAREYGIPTVVNVGNATQVIKTGQIVEVNGNAGMVTIIEPDEAPPMGGGS